ncbi:MAG: PHP domain-containing protein [Proteobacteria bacterium]|nr:PHP domain-containing protein [Pseudomonadota bacterium]MBU1715225.1 PHP domain-containing protein [Pseudomonadota bacterium]
MSPTALIDHAADKGLVAIALTDHDTTSGVEEAIKRGEQRGIEVIPGIEISAVYQDKSLHILGYGGRQNNPTLCQRIKQVQEARTQRNKGIIAKLNQLDINLDFSTLKRDEGKQAGRPHIARLLLNHGIVRSIDEAFIRFLKKGSPAYVAREVFPAQEAIRIIIESGGIPVLAHPASIDPSFKILPDIISELKSVGLAGLEVYYPSHTSKACKTLLAIAKKQKMLITGGSDFHGTIKPDIILGQGYKKNQIPYELLENMKKYFHPN